MSASLYSQVEGVDALTLIARAQEAQRQGCMAVHITTDEQRLGSLLDLCAFFAAELEVVTLPAWDCLPYDRVSPAYEVMGARIRTLHRLLEWQKGDEKRPLLVLMPHMAAMQRLVPPAMIERHALSIQKGARKEPDTIATTLMGQGYERVQTVREAGEYALRGGIFDLWPSGFDAPIRVDFFGDEVESLRQFDPATQISGTDISGFTLLPAGEVVLDEAAIKQFRARYRDHFGTSCATHPVYESISQGRRIAGVEHAMPFFYDAMASLTDYAPGAFLSADDGVSAAVSERQDQIEDYYKARITLDEQAGKSKTVPYNPLPPDALTLSPGEWETLEMRLTTLSPYADPQSEGEPATRKAKDFTDIRNHPDGDLPAALQDYVRSEGKGRKCFLALYGEGARQRVKAMLEASGVTGLRLCNTLEHIHALKEGQIGLAILGLNHGFMTDKYCVVSEGDFLGDRLTRKAAKRKAKKDSELFIRDISALSVGDLVVHDDHGIGRFDGLETVDAAGTKHDCLRLIYAGGDRLFVPVDQIEALSRFGGEEGAAPLDRLGGAGWQARRAKVKRDLLAMAGQLIDLAAKRLMKKADIFSPDATGMAEFASGFPYAETADQMRAITAVLDDLKSGVPMDRLVCGDVGFGKTEVALRAAYAVASEGAQVAMVVPTTLLARQQATQFIQRFEKTGLRVEQLSRFTPAARAKQIKADLARGLVDVIVGTHALLADQIEFANLGLVIVDEEQRFGVKQKERLKNLRADVHILTLTATPIPRTLQMALTGVRDLSLITTPPVDRLAIRTFVLPYDPFVVREALMREHHRGGQSFVVCPRVKDIEKMKKHLEELVPELRVIDAHAQLSTSDLEGRMQAFIDREVDVLLATNIIESGLDIPAANTMIVHRADMFGLAQLYQIRGRIGRGKTRAYAYLTHEVQKSLNDTASKRLEVMGTLDTLGSGFQLASHDMDIRGSGNLLGEEQSGHIQEVGVELYQSMLEEAIAEIREEGQADTQKAHYVPQINLGTSVIIPEDYIPDLQERLTLYRRIGNLLDGVEVEALAAEMIDRFGPLPQAVENLLSITHIKSLCRAAGVGGVEAGPKGAVITFYNDQPPNPGAIVDYVSQKAGTVKLRPDQKLAYIRNWSSRDQRVNGTRQILSELVDLAA